MMLSRAFSRLWLAAGSANLADGILLTGLPLIVLTVGGVAADIALVTVSATVAWPLFGIFAGGIVDRYPAERVAFIVSATRVILFGTFIAITALAPPPILIIAAVAFIYGISETLADTALVALVPRTVRRPDLTRANSRIEATINVANQLLGPPLAGALIVFSSLALLVPVTVLYAITVIALISLGRHLRASAPLSSHPTARHASHTSTVLAGIKHVFSDRRLRNLTLLTAAMSLVWGAWSAVFVVYAISPGPLSLTPFEYGLILSAMAIGGVLASFATAWLRKAIGTMPVLLLDAVGTALLVAPAAVGAPLFVVVTGVVLAGAGSSVWRIVVSSIRQEITPSNLLGRVYSASRVISWGAIPAGAALAGTIATIWGLDAVFISATVLSGAVIVCCALVIPQLDLPRGDGIHGNPEAAP